MDNGDDSQSAQTDSNTSSSNQAPVRRPCCARCRNHRLKVALKGHKRYCKYRRCKCDKCEITADRQRITARQTALIRALAEDENKVIAPEEVEPAPFIGKVGRLAPVSPPVRSYQGSSYDSFGESPVSEHGSNGGSSAISGAVNASAARRLPPLHPQTGSTADLPQAQAGDSVEILLEYTTKLLELFQYPWKMVPLMYLIVKDSGANLEEAVRRIVEANNEIQFWKTMRMVQTDGTYYYGGYTASTGTTGAPTYDGPVPYIGVIPPPGSLHPRLYPAASFSCSSTGDEGSIEP